MKKLLFAALAVGVTPVLAQNIQNNPGSNHGNKFEQLGTILPTPNEYRTASGAPGPKYWQQRADYDIKCELDEVNLKLKGSETITYFNNSPDELRYLWLQLDENEHSSSKNANYQDGSSLGRATTDRQLENMQPKPNDFGVNIEKLTDATGKAIPYTVNKTMMRVDLPVALKPGEKYVLKIDWNYKISDRMAEGGRGGYEFFKEDGNYLFTITQWFPRMCVYSDFQGWQNHQFTGRGEFALTFGNYKVQMTVPADHIVGSTGECLNYPQVLSPTQLARWQKAQTSKEPVEIVTLSDAKIAEGKKAAGKKTWIFKADNVRDFAWTSSRKFIWDAMPAYVEGKKTMCMSFYGKEAYGLYRPYSTKAVAHTIKTYSKFSIPYPYPVAQSVEAANGMEYPMICFNYGRTEKDGTYSEATKYGMLGVIIHEVGHNFFPMIVNSDERQWTWMDEGLNTFVEYLTEELWDNKFPSRRGPAFMITDYMKMPKETLEPIMTNSENIAQFGPNAYSKPATGLNILRETIMGRELFDFAFREYARRWAFKHPTPADLFRTMEDASGEDLDWFWRGWFYSIEACDIAIDTVKYARPDFNAAIPGGGGTQKVTQKIAPPMGSNFEDISKIRNREDKSIVFETDVDTSLRDFYWRYARGLEKIDTSSVTLEVPSNVEAVDAETRAKLANKHLYEISFVNKGGLVMPLIVEFTFTDGTKEVSRIPAQIWRKNENKVTKVFVTDKEVASIKLDPMRETADIDESNNTWPKVSAPSKFATFKMKQGAVRGQSTGPNPMQRSKEKKGF
ncbi:M1 family metallopeptidase [Parasegetibacter sp. NRK P23]|uniref:M1 family metallopeptidase n=1 Tax=Parasegetibacter sp. NRK P23 TaxID=2942999 RepID=UPI0020446528|nr:M1 family metallopeptidase [Parasegetibacter sp. NRK P23]MCM5527199.1 M1 family metallopeptidase [Parasegetibacter sp. NRK P23]